MITVAGIMAALALAFANGANDNFKGVATLYGSRVLGFRSAMLLATAATALGAVVSLLVAGQLVAFFQGKDLLPAAIAGTPPVLLAVAGGAALTVLVATRFGLPVSTTHALTGAIAGVAMVASPGLAPLVTVASKLAAPLLLSPLVALAGAAGAYPLAGRIRRALGIEKDTCACVVPVQSAVMAGASLAASAAATQATPPLLVVQPATECSTQYSGTLLRVEADTAQRWLHAASGGLVCFSRAVNDTPKLAALLLALPLVGATGAIGAIAAAMVVGGVVFGRGVAETMSRKITTMGPGEGLTANMVTSALVLGASQLGMPVSTTHVSVGAVFGIGLLNGTANRRLIGGILLAWLTTLPIGAVLGAGAYALLRP